MNIDRAETLNARERAAVVARLELELLRPVPEWRGPPEAPPLRGDLLIRLIQETDGYRRALPRQPREVPLPTPAVSARRPSPSPPCTKRTVVPAPIARVAFNPEGARHRAAEAL